MTFASSDPRAPTIPAAFASGDPRAPTIPAAFASGDPRTPTIPAAFASCDPRAPTIPAAFASCDPRAPTIPAAFASGDPRAPTIPAAFASEPAEQRGQQSSSQQEFAWEFAWSEPSEDRSDFVCTKCKLVSILEEKIEGLEQQITTLRCIRETEDFLDKTQDRLLGAQSSTDIEQVAQRSQEASEEAWYRCGEWTR
ncbi:unnamed protein product [Caretta caretta]